MIKNEEKSSTYVFGLEHVPLPAVVCDRKGCVLWTNRHFAELTSRTTIPPGSALKDMVQVPSSGVNLTDLGRSPQGLDRPTKAIVSGNAYTMYWEKMGMVFGCVFAPEKLTESNGSITSTRDLGRVSQSPLTSNRILDAFLFLSKELNRTVNEEELIPLFIRIYQDIFPGRLFCIKLFDRESMEFEQVYANGRLREESHARVRITKEAQREHGLLNDKALLLFKDAQIDTTYEYLPIFEDGLTGFDIPLYDGTNFYGVINLEYWKNKNTAVQDHAIAVPLAYYMCAFLRHSRLIAETTVLKDYLEKLLDQANAPVIVINQEKRITVFNQAIERQTGHNRKALLGTGLIPLFREDDQDRMTAILNRVMLGEQQSAIEVPFPHAHGEGEARILFNLAPILSGEEDLEGVILVGQDLTEIRNLQKQIIHSEKLATIGQIAAGVAHEVSNPLTSITVYANYLLKKLEGEIETSDTEKIRRIVEAAARIQTFTRELVAYGRPSREKAVLLEVRSLLEWAVSFCEHLLDRAGAEVYIDAEEGLKRIMGIRGNLEQVFVNLIANACHALQGAGGVIRFNAKSFDDEWISIAITDTGHGIPPDRLERIFEPFYSSKPEGLGTGLGLSIVRNILTDHKAEIDVKSDVGKGTTFTIKIPVALG